MIPSVVDNGYYLQALLVVSSADVFCKRGRGLILAGSYS